MNNRQKQEVYGSIILGLIFFGGSMYFSKHERDTNMINLVEIKIILKEKSNIIEVYNPYHVYIDFVCSEYPYQNFRFCNPMIDRNIAVQISNNLKIGDTLKIVIPKGDLTKIKNGKYVITTIYSLITNGKQYFNVSDSKKNLSRSHKFPKIGALILGIWCILVGLWKFKKYMAVNKVDKP